MAKFPFKNLVFLMQKHLCSSSTTTVVSSSSLASSKSSSFAVQSAIADSEKLHPNENNNQRFDSLLHLFKSHGFVDADITKMIQKCPNLYNNCETVETLRPKLEYLVENGFPGPHLHDLILGYPPILRRSLSCHIKPSLQFLRSFLGTDARVRLAVMRHPILLTCDLDSTLKPNIHLFEKEGIHVDAISQFCVSHSNRFSLRFERMREALESVKDQYAMDTFSSKNLLLAVSIKASMSHFHWEKKLKVLNSYGWSQHHIWSVFRRKPTTFSVSEAKMKYSLDFYVNTMSLSAETIIKYPILLTYSIDKRVRPRYTVMKVLLSKKLLEEDDNLVLVRLVCCNEESFLRKCVNRNLHKVPGLLEMYKKDKMANI